MFQGFQRFKGAIDARIAEEQARQRASTQSPGSRSGSVPRRANSRTDSPSKRSGKPKEADGKAAPAGKGPDPSEFDPEFVIGEDDDQPSRTGTPRPKEKTESTETASGGDKAQEEDGKPASNEEEPAAPEIPPEVQTRLRKLDKLEPKYTGQFFCEV
ncbi:hypothetical protein DM02DRAFT_32892 [Periconia macrospinosa]|uniref:Uncharacterized protein n=1 Tax=Periconia macrospinosa TaxID=97972 RepID=A0A2V1DL86_9PLEO|nr:hypothetical protein DM02DRAFT_32892 [Periconia macrospinosa]